MSLPATQIEPSSGRSSRVSKRSNEDLPEPEGPTRKTNSPLAISREASRRATVLRYVFVTWSSLIICGECSHCGRLGTRPYANDHASRRYPQDQSQGATLSSSA